MRTNLILACLLALTVASGLSAASVSVDSVRQRYPWNGTVDVGYTLTGMEANHLYDLRFEVRANGVVSNVTMTAEPFRVSGSDWMCTDGTYAVSFDLASVFPESVARGARVTANLSDNGEIQWPADATGNTVGIVGDVLVVNLTGGGSADTWPVEVYSDVDTGRFNCDVYKQTKMPLIKVPKGDYAIGSDSFSYNPRKTVTVGKDFWVGMFEMTYWQYRQIMGSGSESMIALGNVGWSDMRGGAAFGVRPTSDCFFYRLNERAKLAGSAVGEWDFPGEVQWEIAARGGKSWEWVCETAAELPQYAIINSGETVVKVGSYLPNRMGFYDSLGNVWEYVADAPSDIVQYTCVDTPYVASGSSCIARGGSSSEDAEWCRVSSRYRSFFSLAIYHARHGFRVKMQ